MHSKSGSFITCVFGIVLRSADSTHTLLHYEAKASLLHARVGIFFRTKFSSTRAGEKLPANVELDTEEATSSYVKKVFSQLKKAGIFLFKLEYTWIFGFPIIFISVWKSDHWKKGPFLSSSLNLFSAYFGLGPEFEKDIFQIWSAILLWKTPHKILTAANLR